MAKADWHTGMLSVAGGDPFADAEEAPDAFKLLCRAVKREAELRESGLMCAIRDHADACCHACPVKGSKGELCKTGLEIERLATKLVATEILEKDDG